MDHECYIRNRLKSRESDDWYLSRKNSVVQRKREREREIVMVSRRGCEGRVLAIGGERWGGAQRARGLRVVQDDDDKHGLGHFAARNGRGKDEEEEEEAEEEMEEEDEEGVREASLCSIPLRRGKNLCA
ncbi:hypothetical protein PUN28_009895 [Cardiocondyla obscurior]|uniref:Uncharacterized protein n=1 Tax=Cardiocondyla obscurior TaxID=286306 RepID=A0AAW2FM94_9HYME